ncbi:ABC transporter permease [Neobacillus kokaensis]|uniref:C1q domain-containing protein n=1 Tax=Neobacillus kokaensis TaxID=2759023 RepID=A0ABQ3N1U3_9BACI|nr:ABC transporter permease [Neobacillus kokaensis]GHH97948.1 hypothetical protein AM1BK_14910 [Neobacillus kokaensis]
MGLQQLFSGFRAFSTTNQPVVGGSVFPVLFQDDFTPPYGFDVMGEYDPATSTFTAHQDGVYSILASIGFEPNSTLAPVNFAVEVDIILNGTDLLTTDLDNVPVELFGVPVVVSTSSIVQLNAGDTLSVQFSAFSREIGFVNGVILGLPFNTHFEAARFPSPLMNNMPASPAFPTVKGALQEPFLKKFFKK